MFYFLIMWDININIYREYITKPMGFDYPLNFEDFSSISGLKIWFPWVHFIAAIPDLFFSFGLLLLLIYISFKNFNLSIKYVYNLLIFLLIFVLFLQLVNPYSSPFVFQNFNVFLRLIFLNELPVYFVFSKNFIIDYYSIILKITILFISIFFLFLFKYYVRFNLLLEYPILVSFLILGLLLLIQSFDLITMYLSLELIGLVSYILAAFAKKSITSLEAGIKYLILGSVASGFILLGIALLYGSTSYIDFYNLKIYFNQGVFISQFLSEFGFDAVVLFRDVFELKRNLFDCNFFFFNIFNNLNLGIFLGSLFINLGFLVKLSAAPFHMWTPDVYEGSPLFTTVLFLSIVKIAIFGFYLRLVYFLFYDFFFLYVQPLLVICGVLSILWGSFGGLGQVRLKRLFAYSGIVNTGFILLGLVEGTTEYSTYVVFLYLCFYFLVNIMVFFFFLITRSSINGESFDFYTDLRGFGNTSPLWAFTFSICLFSLAGIPPFIGFWGKLGVFVSIIATDCYNWSLIFIIIGSVVSSFYYLRLVKVMFFDFTVYKNTFVTYFASPVLLGFYWFFFFFIIFFTLTPVFFENLYDFRLLEFSLFFNRFWPMHYFL